MGLFEKIANLSVVNVIIISVILIVLRWFFFSKVPNEFKGKEFKKHAKEITVPIEIKAWKECAEFCESLAFAFLLVFLFIRPFFIQAYFIPSESMMPGLIVRDHLIAQKFTYFFSDPKFGNVVIFKAPKEAYSHNPEMKPYDPPSDKLQRFWDVISNNDTRPDFIKRVIGEPGDEITMTAGYIKVDNGRIISHAELKERLQIFKKDYGFVKLKGDDVFVDNVKVDKDKVKEALLIPDRQKYKVCGGEVFRNGKKIDEPYIAEDAQMDFPSDKDLQDEPSWIKKSDDKLVAKVPEGKYLVCGDNRNNSYDARYWGFLDRKSIKGQAMFIFWPFNRVKIIH